MTMNIVIRGFVYTAKDEVELQQLIEDLQRAGLISKAPAGVI